MVNSNPNKSRSVLTNKIWESLYNTRFTKDNYIMESLAKERIELNNGIPKLSAKSNELFEEKKLNLVIQMFGFFDSDNDGVISVDKINLENAPKEFLKVLIPISLKIAENSDGIGVEDFYREFNKVYKSLNCQEKAELFKRNSEIGGCIIKEWNEFKNSEQIIKNDSHLENFGEDEVSYNNTNQI